jgi:hypothetical protein
MPITLARQPTQVQLHLTLDQLRDLPGGRDAEAAWRAGQANGDGQPGWLTTPGPGRADPPGQPAPAMRLSHLIAVHQWGWAVTQHPDGTTTAVSPDGHRTLQSHGPPSQAA